MSPKVYRFPMLVLAVSRRNAGFVAMRAPLQLESAQLWSLRQHSTTANRLDVVERRMMRAKSWFEPTTVLLTHGSRWRMDDATRTQCRVNGAGHEVVHVQDACRTLDCAVSLRALALRLIDSYPALEARLHAVLSRSVLGDTARELRPLISALAVAHAAGVTHLEKFQ